MEPCVLTIPTPIGRFSKILREKSPPGVKPSASFSGCIFLSEGTAQKDCIKRRILSPESKIKTSTKEKLRTNPANASFFCNKSTPGKNPIITKKEIPPIKFKRIKYFLFSIKRGIIPKAAKINGIKSILLTEFESVKRNVNQVIKTKVAKNRADDNL